MAKLKNKTYGGISVYTSAVEKEITAILQKYERDLGVGIKSVKVDLSRGGHLGVEIKYRD